MPKNPTALASKLDFTITKNIDDKYYEGTCKCGTFNVVTYYTLNKKKYCWNEDCEFYQRTKLFHDREVVKLFTSVGCKVKDIPTGMVKKTDTITFLCRECGIEQNIIFQNFLTGLKDNKWCMEFLCPCYRSPFKIDTDIVKHSLSLYDLKVDNDFTYISYDERFFVTCGEGHRYNTTLRKIKKAKYCEVCLLGHFSTE